MVYITKASFNMRHSWIEKTNGIDSWQGLNVEESVYSGCGMNYRFAIYIIQCHYFSKYGRHLHIETEHTIYLGNTKKRPSLFSEWTCPFLPEWK